MLKTFFCLTLILTSSTIYPMQDEDGDIVAVTDAHDLTFSTRLIKILVDSRAGGQAPVATFTQIRDLLQSVEPLRIETTTPSAIFIILTQKLEAEEQASRQAFMDWEISQKIRVMTYSLYQADTTDMASTISSLQTVACMSDEEISEAFIRLLSIQQAPGSGRVRWNVSKGFPHRTT